LKQGDQIAVNIEADAIFTFDLVDHICAAHEWLDVRFAPATSDLFLNDRDNAFRDPAFTAHVFHSAPPS